MPDSKITGAPLHAAVEDEDDAMDEDQDEEAWEDEEDENGDDNDNSDEGEGEEWEDDEDGELDHEDVIELAMKTNALLIALFTEPALHRTDPLQTPRPLLNTLDFVRRTYTVNIMPLLPPLATQKVEHLSNPYTPQPALPSDPSILDEANFPELDEDKFREANTRNLTICTIILGRQLSSQLIGGNFDFGEHVVEIATAIAGGEDGEEGLREKYAEKGIDLSKA